MATFPLKRGSQGPEVKLLAEVAVKRFSSYAKETDGSALKADAYFGLGEEMFVMNWQGRMKLPITGTLDKDQFDLLIGKTTVLAPGKPMLYRKIWAYSAPGSGVPWDVGPPHELGERCKKILKINHQPIGYPIGGYLGLMGGDSKQSYIETIKLLDLELERQISMCPDLNDPELEIWLFGYSQSAEGMLDSANRLFGDGGRFAHLRSRVNGLVLFGNPATAVTGIARRIYPDWLNRITYNVNAKNDFYAVATDAIRPAFYRVIIQAETELPFFVHVLRIALPIVMDWASTLLPFLKPLSGGFGPMVQIGMNAIGGLQGIGANPALSGLMGQAASNVDQNVDDEIRRILAPSGILKNIPGLIQLIGALPGLQAHGEYHLIKPEFADGPRQRTGIDMAYDKIASFRR